MSLYHVKLYIVRYYVWAFYACFSMGCIQPVQFGSVIFFLRSYSFPSVFFVRISDKISWLVQ